MLARSHRLFAATAYAGYGVATHQTLVQVGLGALIATATSAGWSSPDLDQSQPVTLLGRALGPAGRLVSHRIGVTHWWVLPVAAWKWWLPSLDPSLAWAVTALLLGWASHIVADAPFGKVPLLVPGWGPMVGFNLKTGGKIEEGFGRIRSPLRTVLAAGLVALMVTAWRLA